MKTDLPRVEHVYQNHILDSTRWSRFRPRQGDIVIVTPYKSGTTWMQAIVLNLIFQDLVLRPIEEYSPWIDLRSPSPDALFDRLEQQEHRRCVKSHLPLDGLPYFSQVQYIVVNRDPRDVFMSLWNHYSHLTSESFQANDDTPGRVGEPFPRCPPDLRAFWRNWSTRGWFPWESEGYPFWANLRHAHSWWNYRHLTNILFVHYHDLLENLPREVRRVATYLGIPVTPDLVEKVADRVHFRAMKRDASTILPHFENLFVGGSQSFIHKGTNGRWHEALTCEDLELYRSAAARELTPDCAEWLERGSSGLT